MARYLTTAFKAPPDASPEVEKLFEQLWLFDSQLGRMLTSGLSFAENFQADVKDIEFVAPAPTWTNFTLAANWSTSAAWDGGPSYRIDSRGKVYLRGLWVNGTGPAAGNTMSTVPAGYRPAGNVMLATATGAPGTGCVFLTSGGTLQYQSGNAAAGLGVYGSYWATSPAAPILPTWSSGQPEVSVWMSKVAGVVPVACRAVDATTDALSGCPAIEWETTQYGTIRILDVSGLTPGRRYRMRLLLFAG